MQFIPSNREDISRYYRNTYIKLKDFGDMLFFVESVDERRVMGKCENGDPFCIYMDEDTPYQVEYILPHKSFFQLDGNAVQLQRVPAKQYFRGLCGSNVQMLYLDRGGQMKQAELNFVNLKRFVAKQAFSNLRAAIGNNDAYTVAMSPRMMYHRAKKEIFVDFTPVARVNTGKTTVYLLKPIFMDDVKELLRAHGDDAHFSVEVFVPPAPKEKTKTEDLLVQMGEKKKAGTKYKPSLQFLQAGILDPVELINGGNVA